ncbi:MAG: hypothetical protein F6K10_17330 [Moorea sp. SIO2B7]|nr:hypothetical protein [Moorena sp. SIO2B7]
MPLNLDDLQITQEERENLINLNIINTIALDFCQGLIIKNSRNIFSLLLTELFSFILLLIVIMPVSLIIIRNSIGVSQAQAMEKQILLIILAISLFCLFIWNLFLWKQAKKVKSLAILINEIDKFNGVIQGIDMLKEIESTKTNSQLESSHNIEEAIEALRITRESLINALKVEEIIRKHQYLMGSRYQLFANLENNLVNLMSFETNNDAREYGQLLNKTLEIGMTVHKEVRKLQNKRMN